MLGPVHVVGCQSSSDRESAARGQLLKSPNMIVAGDIGQTEASRTITSSVANATATISMYD